MLGNLNSSARESFWRHCKTLKPWANHPVLADPSVCLTKLIGVNIHADGAEFYRNDEFYVVSFSSVFGAGGLISDVLMYKFPVCVLAERQMVEPGVLCRSARRFCFGAGEGGLKSFP